MRPLIEKCLRGSVPEPPDVAFPGRPGDVPEELVRAHLREPTPAAVLVPLVERDNQLHLLLTRRADNLRDHPGQISFPGGRVEDGDSDARAAALRETEEEVGIGPQLVTVAGYLRNYLTATGYAVTPVVGFVDPDYELRLDSLEVAEAFEVPLDYAFDPANHVRQNRMVFGYDIAMFEIQYNQWRIWGATAGMILEFYRTVAGSDAR